MQKSGQNARSRHNSILSAFLPVPEHFTHVHRRLLQHPVTNMRVDVRCGLAVRVAHDLHRAILPDFYTSGQTPSNHSVFLFGLHSWSNLIESTNFFTSSFLLILQRTQCAPSLLITTCKVFQRIFRSNLMDQYSIYLRSRRMTCSKSVILLLPLICHNPVIPGFVLIRIR